MSSLNTIDINVVSSASLSPEEESEVRAALANQPGVVMLKEVGAAFKTETGNLRFGVEMPDGKAKVNESLKFNELDFLKEIIGEAMTIDDDCKLTIHLEDEQLTTNRVGELYVLLVYLGKLVGGWESDSEFSWAQEGKGKSSFFWEGDGILFPEQDFD